MDPSFLLSTERVQQALDANLPLWTLTSNEKGQACISRKFTAKNFQCALDCVNAMGAIAEEESHHPDFHLTNYRDVEVILFTHKLGGITESDLKLAEKLDKVEIVYSPKWLKSNPLTAATLAP